MSSTQSGGTTPGLTLADVLFVVFRNKWLILVVSFLGLVGALMVPRFRPPVYQSEAKLNILYVVPPRPLSQSSPNDPPVQTLQDGANGVMNTEVENLLSLDLARQVVSNIGPGRILGQSHGPTDVDVAAGVVLKSLTVEVPRSTSVIHLAFKHSNPALVQPTLQGLIDRYLETHSRTQGAGALDVPLAQETAARRERFEKADEEYRKEKAKIGVASLEETKTALGEEISRLRERISDSEAELAQHQAAADKMSSLLHAQPEASTNHPAAALELSVPPTKLAEYRTVCSLLDNLRNKKQELLVTYTPWSSLVRVYDEQIATQEKLKKQLEDENPGLLAVRPAETNLIAVVSGQGPQPNLISELAQVSALQSKIGVLTSNLAKVHAEAIDLDKAEGRILELKRIRDDEEARYKLFKDKLDMAQTDERFGAGRVSNISIIQSPSPPVAAASKTRKLMMMIFLGSIAGSVALAFIIEFYFDQSLKRPAEVAGRVGVPLFLSIPRLALNGNSRKANLLAENNPSENSGGNSPTAKELEVAPWDPNHLLRPFHDALRDRLINYFEIKNLVHKPKLVAVTGCAEDSGTSTVASGLAASLSETGDGNVLLVDMKQQGASHEFCRGQLACGLDDALEHETREQAQVQDRLYVVTEEEKSAGVMPSRFKHIVPRLRASDYDYIIFDMPPVSQISLTPRLARFMDMVLVVVEAEKTHRDVARRATEMLLESTSHVGVVLNKARSYIPQALENKI